MTHFDTSVMIDAPCERVWAIMCDTERWAEWTSSITSVQPLESGPLALGRRYRIRQPKVPPATWTVTELDDGRSFAWVTGTPLAWVKGRHLVESAGAATRVTLTLDFFGPLGPAVAWLTRGLNQRYIALEAGGLKRRSENKEMARTY